MGTGSVAVAMAADVTENGNAVAAIASWGAPGLAGPSILQHIPVYIGDGFSANTLCPVVQLVSVCETAGDG